MTPTHITRRLLFTLLAGLALNFVLAGGASALPAPVKLQFTGQFGYHVNTTEVNNHTGPEHENICTVISKDECQPGTVNSEPGGFWGPVSVAGAPNGNIYVADEQNYRVQELTSTGRFVMMFGREVNETTKGDVCTAEEVAKAGVVCKVGMEGDLQLSVAVDPVSGDVYAAELLEGPDGRGDRVQQFTAGGQFVSEVGKDVNETKKTNLCTREEEVKETVTCGPPAPYEGPEGGSFNLEIGGAANLLAVGPTGTLYVGEESRVQEFTGAGQPAGEIAVEPGARVDAVAVDQSENVYLYAPSSGINVIREFSKEGSELPSLTVAAEEAGAQVTQIRGLAVDSQGHLAVTVAQQHGASTTTFGVLYEASTGRLLSRFQTSSAEVQGVGFNPGGELYAAGGQSQDVLAYTPKTIAELSTGAAGCVPGAEHETDAVFDCTINGAVDPEGVAETEAWFQWGLTPALGEQTPKQPVAAAGSLPTVIAVRPNSAFYYQLVAEDQNIKAPEVLSGERQAASTPLVAPDILGVPSTVSVTSSAAVLAAQLNPENASTEYLFEYAPSEAALQACTGGIRQGSCPGVATTPAEQSNVYGQVGVSLEAGGLQPATSYSYRLFAENTSEDKSEQFARTGPVASFTTAPEPVPQAQTGPYSNLGATGATIAATVNPDGAPTTYAFELGVYEGADTQFGVVASGNLEASSPPSEETLALSGLQPGTAYAYRISLTSGYIPGEAHTLQGGTVTFTTSGLPAVIAPPAVLAQLPVPAIAFPGETGDSGGAKRVVVCRRGYKRGSHGQCVRKAKPKMKAGRRKKKKKR
jgi:hypothetical protein